MRLNFTVNRNMKRSCDGDAPRESSASAIQFSPNCERKRQGVENTKIPYLEEIAKLCYPDSFPEVTNIDTENYIIVGNGTRVKGLCKDCERGNSKVEGDFKSLAEYCLTVSPAVWAQASDKPQQYLRHENTLKFKEHSHPSYKNKSACIHSCK